MENSSFYVKDENGKLVEAKYLYYDGAPVTDRSFSLEKPMLLYNSRGNLLPEQNVNGYLIVPADYTIRGATNLAQFVSREMDSTIKVQDGTELSSGAEGLLAALGTMYFSFQSDGSQDLQTAYDGKTKQPFVKPFQSAASFNFGLVSAQAGIPLSWAEDAGGLYNKIKKTFGFNVKTGGTAGLAPVDAISVQAGYNFGLKLLGAQPQVESAPAIVPALNNSGSDLSSSSISAASNGATSNPADLLSGGSDPWIAKSFQQGTDDADEWSIDSADFSLSPINLPGIGSGADEGKEPFNLNSSPGNTHTPDPAGGKASHKSSDPSPPRPAGDHTMTAFDMIDAYENLLPYISLVPMGDGALDLGAQPVPGAMQLYEQMFAVGDAISGAEREEARTFPGGGASAETPVNFRPDWSAQALVGALKPNAETIALAAALYKAIHKEVPAPAAQGALAHRNSGPTGRRDDPIIIHHNGNMRSTRTMN